MTTVTAVPPVSGDSVTLLCKSDSNPISNYTWTRRTEGGVKLVGNGNNLTLHSGADGFYYCTATNQLGSSDSPGWEYTADTDNSAVKYTAIAVTVALVLIFIVIILWMRRRASAVSTRSEEHGKNDSVHVYDNISVMTSDPTQTASSEDQDNVQYSTVLFSQCRTDEVSLYSTVQLPNAFKQEEEVEYATVSRATPRVVGGNAAMLARKRNPSAAVILILLAGVQAQHSVTLSSQSLCVLTGSTVKIPCTFTTPDHSSVTQREWYRSQSSKGKPQDLSTDPQYSGRVSVSTVTSDCELTVRNVRVSDSGVYNFRFQTENSHWISASIGVHLTVTDLKVTVSNWDYDYKELSCITTCTLSNTVSYIWYKNGQPLSNRVSHNQHLYTKNMGADSYSCAVGGHEDLRSPAVCVDKKKSCWSVTYSTLSICSLIGSSVDIHSYYTFPRQYKVTKVFWFIKDQADGEPVDVRENEEYQGRVQYTHSSQNNCSLRITNLTERDAQTYRFRFYTDDHKGKYTGEPGVSLSVTDLKVTVLDSGWLSCITTCTLSNNPIYIWYKDGQRVTDQNRNDEYLYISSGDSGSYSCAVEGHEDLRSPAVCKNSLYTSLTPSSSHCLQLLLDYS
ncbi:uncharacterized protein LOC128518707 [Clarias gariepinus]|uniref:uncharacterized protein LOC128518707 n=1 Tax=Clarias gariepinus TaxID=13013 RepID=UPI00234CF567|nr:uncharacterized protein LOC128518707 [Clarias gariepinus]